jgi:hypothetical protein
MYTFSHRKRLLAALNRTRPGDNRQIWSSEGRITAGKTDDSVVGFHVSAYQFVGFSNANYFLYTRHFIERARLNLAAVSGDANGRAFCAWDGMGAISKCLNLVAYGPNFFRPGVRLHDYQHDFTSNLQV